MNVRDFETGYARQDQVQHNKKQYLRSLRPHHPCPHAVPGRVAVQKTCIEVSRGAPYEHILERAICRPPLAYLFVMLQTLRCSAADHGGNGAPLGRHELCQMEKLLLGGREGEGREREVRWDAAAGVVAWTTFSSSSLLHSVFLMLGSSHSNQRHLHCLALCQTSGGNEGIQGCDEDGVRVWCACCGATITLRCSNDAIRPHCE